MLKGARNRSCRSFLVDLTPKFLVAALVFWPLSPHVGLRAQLDPGDVL